VALLVVAALVVAGFFAARQVYFLGTDEGGRLALYRGLPYDLPLNIELYSEVTSSPTLVASLPEDRRDEATGHELRSREDAVDLLGDLERSATETTTEPPDTNGQQRQQQDQQGQKQGGGERDQAGDGGRKDRKKRSSGG
ncbi:MAG: hypothetical protein M3Y34_00575, partial [Actinomycetota bacterium]|nr:hypothetical protein [Actinomycetota bacterium]